MKKLTEMTGHMKAKYSELFINALDTMEAAAYQTPWVTPNHGSPCNLYRQNHPYQGVNQFLLQLLCSIEGFQTPYFVTFNDMTDEGNKYKGIRMQETPVMKDGQAVVDKNGKPVVERPDSFTVILFLPKYRKKGRPLLKQYDYDHLDEKEKEGYKKFYTRRVYSVWNIDQTDFKEVYPDDYADMTEVEDHVYQNTIIDPALDMMIMGGKWICPILFGGSSSHYSPSEDHIRLPVRRRFNSDAAFYGVALHEMAHSTAKELKREAVGRFGDKSYAEEEFVAELTSACVCSMLGVGKLLDEQHISYVENWRRAIREDTSFVPRVIDQVQRASNFILKRYKKVVEEMGLPRLLTA